VRAWGWTLAVLAIAIVGSAARAGTLPAGTGFVQCTTSAGYITDPTSCNGGTDNGQVTYAPLPGVGGNANGYGLVEEAGVFGVLNYSFEVIGGKVGDVVPVDIDTVLTAIPNSIGYVFSEITVAANTSTGETICSSSCGAGDGETGFTGTLQVDAVAGTIYTNAVHLEIEAIGAYGTGSDYDGGTASADPHLFIPSTFPNVDEYSIVVSPNIGNAVPEPSTWVMMLIGFAGLGFGGFRAWYKRASLAAS